MSIPIILALIWRPAAAPMLIFGGAALLAALAILVYARTFALKPVYSVFLLAMRLIVVAALAVVLMGPSRVPEQKQELTRPSLAILLDTSQSMLTPDCSGTSRLRFAIDRWLSDEQIAALSQKHTVELIGFDEQLTPVPLSRLARTDQDIARGRVTWLVDCLTAMLLKMPVAGDKQSLLIISDGRDSDDQSIQPVAVLARSRNIPVHTVCLGGDTLQRDIALMAQPMQDYVLAGEPGDMMIKVYQVGLDHTSTTFEVQCGNDRQTFPVQFNGKHVVEMNVPIKHDVPGRYEYTVRIEPVEGEIENANNAQVVFCEVVRQRVRVLIIEGQPYWDTKFLAQSLRKDERIELTQVTQLSGKRTQAIVTRADESSQASGNSGPIQLKNWTREDFAKFDVIMLGNRIEHVLDASRAGMLREFVSNGGHVIFLRGMPYDVTTPEGRIIADELAEVEPVFWSSGIEREMTLALTISGKSSPWLSSSKMGHDVDDALSRLAGFILMTKVEREKTATVVLARARPPGAPPGGEEDGEPALVSMTYGRGDVIAILGEGLWQWSLLDRKKQDLAGFYDALWSNLVRWLAMGGDFAPGKQVSVKVSRSSVQLGEPLTVDVVFRVAPPDEATPSLRLMDPAGEAVEVALHRLPGRDARYRATINPNRAGIHKVRLNGQTAEEQQEVGFSVYDINTERLMTSADPNSMRLLAEQSGGEVLRPNDPDALLAKLERRQLMSVVPVEPEFVWDQAWILFALLGWGGLEWLIRRKAGLL